jgi:UDP-glucose 4-epimerase
MEITGKRILVTGGAGLVGSHIVDELVRQGAGEVVVYDSLVRGKPDHLAWAIANGNVRLVQGDIRDRAALGEAFRGVDLAFHQAAMWLRQCQERPREGIEANVLGTFNVLEACVEAGVQKIVAASSSSVYGDGLYLPTDEVHPFNNDLFYGMTKVAGEQLLRCFYKAHGLKYVAFRYLNVYGPRQPYQAAYMDVIMHFLNRIDAGEPPRIEGDGTQTVDLVYVADVARANVVAMQSDVENDVFNVASGKETSLNELADVLLELSGRADLRPTHVPRDGRLVTRRWGSPDKAKELLGFETTTSVREGMQHVIDWRRAQLVSVAQPA